MNERFEKTIINRISIDVPDMDKNKAMIFDTENINISCRYDSKYTITEIKSNRSGLLALAKILLQLAHSSHDVAHVELDEYNYFEENSNAISIEKIDNT